MADMSHLDQKYFISSDTFNCPFCKRNNVVFDLVNTDRFDWELDKDCNVYFVRCRSCSNKSIHFSFEHINVKNYLNSHQQYFDKDEGNKLDDYFFFSIPTSFFVLDERIPKKYRELLSECEICLKNNLLTGGSACVRKVVYELGIEHKAEGIHYDDRIKSLKTKLPKIDPGFFDTLLAIHNVTSDKVHEESYDGWQNKHLRMIMETLKEILNEIYVVPKERQDRSKKVLEFKAEVLKKKKSQK